MIRGRQLQHDPRIGSELGCRYLPLRPLLILYPQLELLKPSPAKTCQSEAFCPNPSTLCSPETLHPENAWAPTGLGDFDGAADAMRRADHADPGHCHRCSHHDGCGGGVVGGGCRC